MRIRLLVLGVSLALAISACTENGGPRQQNKPLNAGAAGSGVRVPMNPAAGAGTAATNDPYARPQASAAPAITQQQALADMPVPPDDAQWTIYCKTIPGEQHIRVAKQMKEELVRNTGLKQWYLVHSENESSLYYGFYRTTPGDVKDRAEADRAQKDKLKLAALQDAMGDQPFRHCLFVPLNSNDPPAPPEWNLANAKGHYTVAIGEYRDSLERKRAAVDAVKAARAQGVEAYFYHGETASIVCVGAWPETAVKGEAWQEPGSTNRGVEADPSRAVVVSNVPLPGVGDQAVMKSGEVAQVYTPKLEIVDPALAETMKRFDTYSVNGMALETSYRDPKTGQKKRAPLPSSLVLIPRKDGQSVAQGSAGADRPAVEGREAAGSWMLNPTAGQSTSQSPPQNQQTPQGGRLRSLGN